jgi:hypothetical protein
LLASKEAVISTIMILIPYSTIRMMRPLIRFTAPLGQLKPVIVLSTAGVEPSRGHGGLHGLGALVESKLEAVDLLELCHTIADSVHLLYFIG